MKNNALKFVVTLLIIIFITSCAGNRNWYPFKGVKYYNKEEALFAVQTYFESQNSQVQPFLRPLVDKKLIVSIPTKEQIYSYIVYRKSKKSKYSVSSAERDSIDYFAQSIHIHFKSFYEMVKKKNIYKTVELVEGSYTSIIQPSPSCDTICRYSSGEGNDVWFMLNVKNGKQVLSFDESLPAGPARSESLLNAVKAFALQ